MAALLAASNLAVTGAAFAQVPAPAAAASAGMPPLPPDCRPAYPKAAERAQVQGVSTLAFQVDATGKITGGEVVRSAGRTREHRMLDSAALAALVHCPVTVERDEQGKPVASTVVVNYTWRLE